MNPKMLLIFEKDYVDKVSRGELCAFAAHAAMNLALAIVGHWDTEYAVMSGKFLDDFYVCDESEDAKLKYADKLLTTYHEWLNKGYKKIVLYTDKPIDDIFAWKGGMNNWACLQLSAHKDNLNKPICLAIFGESKDLDKISKDMVLLQ